MRYTAFKKNKEKIFENWPFNPRSSKSIVTITYVSSPYTIPFKYTYLFDIRLTVFAHLRS